MGSRGGTVAEGGRPFFGSVVIASKGEENKKGIWAASHEPACSLGTYNHHWPAALAGEVGGGRSKKLRSPFHVNLNSPPNEIGNSC